MNPHLSFHRVQVMCFALTEVGGAESYSPNKAKGQEDLVGKRDLAFEITS
jgi:hypothetical protein